MAQLLRRDFILNLLRELTSTGHVSAYTIYSYLTTVSHDFGLVFQVRDGTGELLIGLSGTRLQIRSKVDNLTHVDVFHLLNPPLLDDQCSRTVFGLLDSFWLYLKGEKVDLTFDVREGIPAANQRTQQ